MPKNDNNWRKEIMSMQQYYGEKGTYLDEHKNYFTKERTSNETDFLVKALNMQRKDRIIDLACGHGRHSFELAKRGFTVVGVDQSEHLISLCKSRSTKEKIDINFYSQNIIKLNLPDKYNKAFLFFSEFGQFHPTETLKNINRGMEEKGELLIDTDFFLRVIRHLKEKKDSQYYFDLTTMTLIGGKNDEKVRYYTFPEMVAFLKNSGFIPLKFFGDYNFKKPVFDSPRMIIISRKERTI
jgi:ubiquinone/menaquinone biosynthesis C-methylase UbiE